MHKTVIMLLFSALLPLLSAAEIHFQAGQGTPPFKLQNGAEITQEGYLRLNGNGACAELLADKEAYLSSSRGTTIIAILKPVEYRDCALLERADSFRLGLTSGRRYNLSTAWDQAPKAAFVSGMPVTPGEGWDIVAAHVERHVDTANGINAVRLTLFVNGQQMAQREVNNVETFGGNLPFFVGKGQQSFFGDIAALHLFQRILSEDEIEKIAQESGVPVRLSRSQNQNAALTRLLEEAESKATLPEAKWMLACLKDYANLGTDTQTLLQTLQTATVALQAQNTDTLMQAWNRQFPALPLLSTPDLLLLLASKGSVTAFLGAYNCQATCPLFGTDGFSWSLEYEDMQQEVFRLAPADGTMPFQTSIDGGNFSVTWHSADFTVSVKGNLAGARLAAKIDVENHNPNLLLTKVFFPIYTLQKLPGQDFFLLPKDSGAIFDNPTGDFRIPFWEYPMFGVTMQLTAYYNASGNGIYLAMEDPKTKIKSLGIRGRQGRLTEQWRMPVPFQPDAKSGGNSFASDGAVAALELYRGDWFEACQIYKKFLATTSWGTCQIPRQDTPKWFRDNCVWVQGLDANDADTPFPLEGFRYFQDYFEVPTAFVSGILYTPNGPQRFGPDFHVWNTVKEGMKEANKLGLKILPYYNSRIWYCGEGAEKQNKFESEGKDYVIRERSGKPRIENYGQPMGIHAVMCQGTKVWREKIWANAERIAEGGISGVYHDQLSCAPPFLCFCTNHEHLPGDPAVWTAAHRQIYNEGIMGPIRQKYPELAHTCEEGAEPYLLSVDGFVAWRYGQTGHVPAFQAIFSPRIQFVGRGDFAHNAGDKMPYEHYFPKFAEQLVYGEQIGWVSVNTVRFPSPLRSWLKKLAFVRHGLADFLNASEMQKPIAFTEKLPQYTSEWGVVGWENQVTVDKILHGVWKHQDGRVVVLFVNTDTRETLTAKVPADYNIGRNLAVLAEGQPPRFLDANTPAPTVTLQPLEIQLWLLSEGMLHAWAQNFTALQQRLPGLMDDLGVFVNQRPDFSKCLKLDASKHEYIRLKDASWLLGANRFTGGNLGYHSTRMPDNWAVATPGAEIYFGDVDFGQDAKVLEAECSAFRPGVTIEVLDLTFNHPLTVLATFELPITKGWYDYETVTANLKRPVSGHRNILFRVKGGNCNLKGWRVAE